MNDILTQSPYLKNMVNLLLKKKKKVDVISNFIWSGCQTLH